MLIKGATETSNRVSLGLKCGDCIHLERGPACFEKLCGQLGKSSFSEACPSFTPNLCKVSFIKKGHLETMAEVFRELTPQQSRLLAYTFRNLDFIKRAGYEFGETVVFSLGGEYLECYVRGLVIGADRTGEQVYITSDFEGLNGDTVMLTLLRPSVMNMATFAKHRKQLVEEGRIVEPQPPVGTRKRTTLQWLKMASEERALYRQQLATKPVEYVPPSIDTVPKKWLDSRVLEQPKMAKKKAVHKGKTSDAGFTLQRYTDSAGEKSDTANNARSRGKRRGGSV